MATTLKIQSFTESNIRERTELKASVASGAVALPVRSAADYEVGDVIYVGALSRDGCEKAIVQAISAELITIAAPLAHDHGAFEPIVSVVGELIRIYRAVNVDGSVPADELFSPLTTRTIDADQESTYYTDSAGSANYWYRSTYINAAMTAETSLAASEPVRGDDFGHYASLSAIRAEAGFESATNLNDVDVDAKRREAESEINSALGAFMTTPFKAPVPAIIKTITIKLAGGLLFAWAYRRDAGKDERVKEARQMLKDLQSGQSSTGESGDPSTDGVSYEFGDAPRMFSVKDRF